MKSLKEVYKDYFNIGAAINTSNYKKCKDLIVSQFNTVTCENEMKYSSLCNEREEYDFSGADELYGFAKENGIAIRGHNLVWHQSIPTEHLKTFAPEALWERIKEHITIVSQRYSDVSCWDVINEAVDDKNGLYLRDTVWYEKFGENYIEKIYSLARELIPNVPLVYNDYNEYVPEKREKIVRLAGELKAKGLIDAIGMQGHITIPDYFSIDELKRSIESFGKLGVRLQVTEMDISLPAINDSRTIDEVTPREIEAHAKLYGDVFAVYREYSELIDSVTLWGVSDDQTWLNYAFGGKKRNGLLFDRNYRPNEAFLRVTEF